MPESVRSRLLAGETLSPGNGIAKGTLTSTVSTLRRQGYDVESLGHYSYRVVQTTAQENGQAPPEERPPLPGETLSLTVTGLSLAKNGELVIDVTDGARSWVLPY
jgi:biotin operon repressor